MSNTLLEVRGLNTYYGASHVLRNLDFQVERGQAVGLMGRNGMGKSTLLKSIMGLVKPRSGRIAFQACLFTVKRLMRLPSKAWLMCPKGGVFLAISACMKTW
jgi:ABC-type branched-subunit amino acid transport system ATPase component